MTDEGPRGPVGNDGPWVQFEGPGKLHTHRWHRVKPSPLGRYVTLCGLYVYDARITDSRGEGTECGSCERLVKGPVGGYL